MNRAAQQFRRFVTLQAGAVERHCGQCSGAII